MRRYRVHSCEDAAFFIFGELEWPEIRPYQLCTALITDERKRLRSVTDEEWLPVLATITATAYRDGGLHITEEYTFELDHHGRRLTFKQQMRAPTFDRANIPG